MKIFVDTAILEEIEQAKSYGILDGVTTNPSLMKKAVENLKSRGENVDMEKYIKSILKVCKGLPVSLEVTTSTYNEMVEEGRVLYKRFNKVAKNVVIKIPVNPGFQKGSPTSFDGLKAIKELSSKGIPINCTLIFTPEQALLAAKAGATYVSPFAGRIDDLLRTKAGIKFEKTDYFSSEGIEKKGILVEDNGIISGIHLVSECVEILKRHKFKTEVIAASLRNSQQVREAALSGSHIATIPLESIKESIEHEKTIEGMKSFTADVVDEYAILAKR